ncbi:ATP-binding protein [Nonomuraea typhae]|uniref:ATP-binding protein n=1 Tax=Nonomuraea typhae TaxID=2603600 RepID=UPI00248414FA|nr:ATP-binding protein [Nonomuraea typhae]
MAIYSFPPTQPLQPVGILYLACSDRAPYLAREAVSVWLRAAHPAREITVLAASELVTNAVRYADASRPGGESGDSGVDGENSRGLITLKLCQGSDYLRLGVTDPGSSCSQPSAIPLQAPSLEAERGRGLAIVQALSRGRWGSFRLPVTERRVVWCHLDLDPTPAQIEELFLTPA